LGLEIILVLGLGFPEIADRRHFGHHLARPNTRGVDFGYGVVRDVLLFIIGVEDRRAIACADIVALAVACRRIMNLEEEYQQIAVADRLRIEHDLDRLGVAAMIAIGGVGHLTAGVADAGGYYAGIAADQILHTPEAAAGKHCAFGCHGLAPPEFGFIANIGIVGVIFSRMPFDTGPSPNGDNDEASTSVGTLNGQV